MKIPLDFKKKRRIIDGVILQGNKTCQMCKAELSHRTSTGALVVMHVAILTEIQIKFMVLWTL